MFFFYEILAITFLLFSPIIFAVRIIIGKEDFNRFLEKFCIFKKYKMNVNNQKPVIVYAQK